MIVKGIVYGILRGLILIKLLDVCVKLSIGSECTLKNIYLKKKSNPPPGSAPDGHFMFNLRFAPQ